MDIIIKQNDGGSFDVHQGDKYADEVTWHEMLGLVAALTMSDNPTELKWLKTKEQHEILRSSWTKKVVDTESE